VQHCSQNNHSSVVDCKHKLNMSVCVGDIVTADSSNFHLVVLYPTNSYVNRSGMIFSGVILPNLFSITC
jgi:hypothetical protein